MSQAAENPRAVSGANNPPDADPLLIEATERIDTANRYLTERADINEWTAEIADKANFFLGQCAETWTALDGQRLQEGRDFKLKQDIKYNSPLTLLTMAKTKLAALKSAYLKKKEDELKEQQRIAQEKANKAIEDARLATERAAAEAIKKGGDPLRAELQARQAAEHAEELQEAAAAVPEKAVIKGAFNQRASGLKDYWSGEIVDLNEAFKHFNKKGNPYKTTLAAAIQDAIQSIANKEAVLHKDETKAPPGIKFLKDRR